MSRIPVVVERLLSQPTTLKDIEALDRAGEWCITANGAAAVLHAIAPGGTRSLCIYRAPDADAMRRVADRLSAGIPSVIWPATEHWSSAGGSGPELVCEEDERVIGLVERHFDRPTTFSEADAVESAQGHCLKIARVRFLRSYMSRDGRQMLCLYAAPDLEAIRSANRLIDLPMSEVLAVRVRTSGMTSTP
jgi:hypothetical protein